MTQHDKGNGLFVQGEGLLNTKTRLETLPRCSVPRQKAECRMTKAAAGLISTRFFGSAIATASRLKSLSLAERFARLYRQTDV